MAEVRAPVSTLALMAFTPRSGNLSHSRQPTTGSLFCDLVTAIPEFFAYAKSIALVSLAEYRE
jgi:hypothetical protein